jgi:hypothetical protein
MSKISGFEVSEDALKELKDRMRERDNKDYENYIEEHLLGIIMKVFARPPLKLRDFIDALEVLEDSHLEDEGTPPTIYFGRRDNDEPYVAISCRTNLTTKVER